MLLTSSSEMLFYVTCVCFSDTILVTMATLQQNDYSRHYGTHFSNQQRDAQADLGGWLHTEIVYLPDGSHLSRR